MSNKRYREKQQEYWRKRNAELSRIVDTEADEVIRNMRDAYDSAARHIDQQINEWYQKFADENGMTYADAKQTLDRRELREFKMTLEEYIAHGEQLDVNHSWLKAMKNASARHHIDRLTALKMTTQAELEEAIAKIDGTWMERMAKEAYLYALYSAQLSINTGFNAPNIEKVMRTARKPWTPDGIEFAERASINNARLVQKIQRELTQAAITGDGSFDIAKRVAKDFELTEYEAARIVRTESTHIETEASMQSYKDCGISRYQVLGTLDRKMCALCAKMDMTVWKVSERTDGFNAPPFHPNCRCTTIAYFDDPELQGTRAAKNADGKTVYVPDTMTYDEWREKFGNNMASENSIKWPKEGTKITREEFKELREYARKKGVNLAGVKDSDLDVEAVKSAIDGTAAMLDKYGVRDRIKHPMTMDFSQSLQPNDFATTYPGINHIIYFNRDAYRSLDALKTEYAKLAEQGHFVRGTDHRAIPYHEMGHIVSELYKIDPMEVARKATGLRDDADIFDYTFNALSEYSTYRLDGSEILAECFAAVGNGVENEFALRYVKECAKIISRR